jgi:hypothetical protein
MQVCDLFLSLEKSLLAMLFLCVTRGGPNLQYSLFHSSRAVPWRHLPAITATCSPLVSPPPKKTFSSSSSSSSSSSIHSSQCLSGCASVRPLPRDSAYSLSCRSVSHSARGSQTTDKRERRRRRRRRCRRQRASGRRPQKQVH